MDNSIQHRVFRNCIGRGVHPKITGFELVLDCPCLTSGGDFKVISSAFEFRRPSLGGWLSRY